MSHETRHILDHAVGKPATSGLAKDEMAPLDSYGTIADQFNDHKLFTAKDHGYSTPEFRGEHMAEAFRQYMTAPDTFKARFPKTAALIRNAVNSKPKLMVLIQFNSLAAGAYGLSQMILERNALAREGY